MTPDNLRRLAQAVSVAQRRWTLHAARCAVCTAAGAAHGETARVAPPGAVPEHGTSYDACAVGLVRYVRWQCSYAALLTVRGSMVWE